MVRVLMLVFWLTAGMSAALAQNVNLVGALDETVHPSARSSGVAVVGVQSVMPRAEIVGVDAFDFAFFQPDTDPPIEFVCVSTESADGLYDGRGTFKISRRGDPSGQLRHAQYPTKYHDRLRDLGADELALAIRPGRCGRAPLGEGQSEGNALKLVLGAWRPANAAAGLSRKVHLMVNPFDAERIRASVGDRHFPCSQADVAVAASYTMVCTIDLGAITASPAMIRLETVIPGQTPETTFIELFFPRP